MRPLERFRIEKNYNYTELHVFLKSKGINVVKITSYFWCKEGKNKRFPKQEMIFPLSKVTGIPIKDFLLDCKDKYISSPQAGATGK